MQSKPGTANSPINQSAHSRCFVNIHPGIWQENHSVVI